MAPPPVDMIDASMSPDKFTVKQQFGCCTLQSLGPVHWVNTPPSGHEVAHTACQSPPAFCVRQQAAGAWHVWVQKRLAISMSPASPVLLKSRTMPEKSGPLVASPQPSKKSSSSLTA